MQDDDELCLCFHVKLRKVKNFIKVEKPKVASQLSECGGAGTGCGWCRPMLRRLLADHQKSSSAISSAPIPDAETYLPDAETYASQREQYKAAKREDGP